MNKKGFTLVELLAIIVILAIIAVITVPIILNVIDNSKKGAAQSSVLGYAKAVEYAYAGNHTLTGENETSRVTQTVKVKESDGQTHIETLGVNYDGDSVTDCRAIVENNRLTLKNCKVNSYSTTIKFNYSNGEVTEKQASSTSSTPSFATDDWDDILDNLDDNREFYPIGAEKTIAMDINGDGTDEVYTLRIVNRNSCPLTWEGSETACGVVLEFKDIITSHIFNYTGYYGTNVGGWPATNTINSLYTYINDTIYNKLPSELKNLIIDTKTISGHGLSDSSNFESMDKLYLYTSGELGAQYQYDTVELAQSNDYVGTGKTRTLEYYINSNYNVRRKKYNNTDTGYWLRSARSDSNTTFLLVGSAICDNNAFNTFGIAPAFRILD